MRSRNRRLPTLTDTTALSCIDGPLGHREQHALLERFDWILSFSDLEQDFIKFALVGRKIATDASSTNRLERFSVLALRDTDKMPVT